MSGGYLLVTRGLHQTPGARGRSLRDHEFFQVFKAFGDSKAAWVLPFESFRTRPFTRIPTGLSQQMPFSSRPARAEELSGCTYFSPQG